MKSEATSTTIRDPQPGDPLESLDTPVLVVDLECLNRNIREWQSWMDEHSVKFRPHIKTHKIPEIAQLQIAAGATGIVCAKISEAEPFAAAGVRDICIAYPVFGEVKWQRIANMAKLGVRMTVNCDNEQAVKGLSAAATAANVTIYLQIDIDSGMHRGGIPFSNVTGIERLARIIRDLPGIQFDGITTFRATSFSNAPDPRRAGHEEARLLVEIADQLRSAGIPVNNVTAGSTPTGRFVAEVKGITEVRAGTYVFNDLMQLETGSARNDQLAMSVLCTVVSRGEHDRITIDAGSKTFSGDIPKQSANADKLAPLAQAVDQPVFVERFSEEHGVARAECNVPLGSKLRFFPYHVCTCLNMSDKVMGIRNNKVEVVWPVKARGLRS